MGPRSSTRGTWRVLAFVGLLVGGATFAAFGIGRALGGDVTQTMAFATLALGELALVYGMRSPSTAAWQLPPNRWLNLSVAASVALVIGIVFLPQAHAAFATAPLDLWQSLIVAGLALTPLVGLELLKAVRRHRLDSGPPRVEEELADRFPRERRRERNV